jgi:hypothetical protein
LAPDKPVAESSKGVSPLQLFGQGRDGLAALQISHKRDARAPLLALRAKIRAGAA